MLCFSLSPLSCLFPLRLSTSPTSVQYAPSSAHTHTSSLPLPAHQVAEDAATGNAPTNVGGNERNVMAKYGAGGEEEGVGEAAAAQAAAADLDEDL